MTILSFLVQVLGGAMLLLFAVHFMRLGIEQLWSGQIRAALSDSASTPANLAKGAGLGFAMQGGTAVILMAAGLAGSGAIPAVSAAVVALGADMGSALAVRFLHLPIAELGPLAILVGVLLHLRAPRPRMRQVGRVVLGFGLILLALTLIRQSVAPLGALSDAPWAVAYLDRDPVAAALAGIALTLLMHSSIAAVLTAVAIAAHADVGAAAALCFMLGCNFGSALLPLWMLKHEAPRARQVAFTVALLRCTLAVAAVLAIVLLRAPVEGRLPLAGGDLIVWGHLAFNAALLCAAPLCAPLLRALASSGTDQPPEIAAAGLPAGVTEDAGLALPSMKRMLSGMLDLASAMLDEVTSDSPDPEAVAAHERRMNAGLARIRETYSRLPSGDDDTLADARQVLEFAIRIERCGDLLSTKVLALRLEQVQGAFRFTDEGAAEITDLVDAVRKAIILAHDTAWTGDLATAQRLVRHKRDVTEMESRSRSRHFARLRRGNPYSIASSNQHLEVIAALKELNSKFATIGYAVLDESGGLRKTRLKSGAKEPV